MCINNNHVDSLNVSLWKSVFEFRKRLLVNECNYILVGSTVPSVFSYTCLQSFLYKFETLKLIDCCVQGATTQRQAST